MTQTHSTLQQQQQQQQHPTLTLTKETSHQKENLHNNNNNAFSSTTTATTATTTTKDTRTDTISIPPNMLYFIGWLWLNSWTVFRVTLGVLLIGYVEIQYRLDAMQHCVYIHAREMMDLFVDTQNLKSMRVWAHPADMLEDELKSCAQCRLRMSTQVAPKSEFDENRCGGVVNGATEVDVGVSDACNLWVQRLQTLLYANRSILSNTHHHISTSTTTATSTTATTHNTTAEPLSKYISINWTLQSIEHQHSKRAYVVAIATQVAHVVIPLICDSLIYAKETFIEQEEEEEGEENATRTESEQATEREQETNKKIQKRINKSGAAATKDETATENSKTQKVGSTQKETNKTTNKTTTATTSKTKTRPTKKRESKNNKKKDEHDPDTLYMLAYILGAATDLAEKTMMLTQPYNTKQSIPALCQCAVLIDHSWDIHKWDLANTFVSFSAVGIFNTLQTIQQNDPRLSIFSMYKISLMIELETRSDYDDSILFHTNVIAERVVALHNQDTKRDDTRKTLQKIKPSSSLSSSASFSSSSSSSSSSVSKPANCGYSQLLIPRPFTINQSNVQACASQALINALRIADAVAEANTLIA